MHLFIAQVALLEIARRLGNEYYTSIWLACNRALRFRAVEMLKLPINCSVGTTLGVIECHDF